MKSDFDSKIKALDGLLTHDEDVSSAEMRADLEARGFAVDTWLQHFSQRIAEARGALPVARAAVAIPPPVLNPPEQPARRALLPDWLSRHSLLLWIGTLPQVILLLINLRAYRLITGELDAAQRTIVFRLFGLELVLLAGVTFLALVPLRRLKEMSWWTAAPIFLTAAGYLWAIFANLENIIPSSVAAWMLPPEMQVYYQFILVMPVVFFTGIWMSCRPTAQRRGAEFALLGLIIIGVPVSFSAMITVYAHAEPFRHRMIAEVILGIVMVSGSAVVLGAVARLCVAGYKAIRRQGRLGQGIFIFLVGIAAPLGGLVLNHHIPFPSDFQAWPVYVMAALNGLILLLPQTGWIHRPRAIWLAQCAMFPFTLYFFLVFLPFLPLSIVALAIAGAGFLILAPTVLFLIHGQELLEGYRREVAKLGRLRTTLLGASAMAMLFAFFLGEAVWDRTVLRSALDYVYSPDLRHQDQFHRSRLAVQRSLNHLRDFKAGVQLPFLSDFYTWAVFDNLVLPDDKMDTLHQAFFGSNLSDAAGNVSIFGGRPSRGRVARERAASTVVPPSNVKLDKLTATTTQDGTCERTTFHLELLGLSNGQNEFNAEIKIPEGVFISGFWLKIGEQMVPGRLFEKKAAMWVYQKISQVQRCDPGLLVYRDAGTVDLKIFPITGSERRYADLEILYPAGRHPALTIGDQSWQAEGSGPATVFTMTDEGTSSLDMTPDAIAKLPRAARTPYLHFIIDRSQNAVLPDDQIAAAMREAAAKFPGVTEGMATWANYEFSDLTGDPVPLAQVSAASLSNRPPKRGGLLAERAVERALLTYRERLVHAVPGSPWLKRYPVFVVLGSKAGSFRPSKDFASFASFAPDSEIVYTTPDATTWEAYDFQGAQWVGPSKGWETPERSPAPPVKTLPWEKATHPTALLQVGDAVVPCPLDAEEPRLLHFDTPSAGRVPAVLDGAVFRPLAVTTTVPPDAPYARGMLAEQRYRALTYNPSLGNRGLAAIVQVSRETGILLGATSFIVVENSAQWETLRRKEQQKLGNQNALEFEETPEPTAGLLVLAGGALLLARRRRS